MLYIGLCRRAEHREKSKKAKRNKYLDLARELRKLWNMRVTVLPIGALGRGREVKELEIEGRIETIQITTFCDRPEYWEETCCHSDSSERPSADSSEWPSADAGVEKLAKCIIIQYFYS